MKDKIIIIDDEKAVREVCERTLEKAGYEIAVFSNGFSALDEIRKTHVDLVITDIMMPDMDGMEILEKIKVVSPGTEVMVMTGYATIESAVKAMRNGAYDYLPKPFDLEYLREKVKQCIKNKRLSERIENLKEIVGLYEVSQAMSSSLGVKDLLNLILDIASKALDADCGSIMLLDEKREHLQVKAYNNLGAKYVNETIKVGQEISGWVVDKGEPLLITGDIEDYPFLKDTGHREEILSSIVVPLKVKGDIIGVINLNITNPSKIFVNKHLKLLEIFAVNAAVAIHDAGVHDKMLELDKLKTEFVSNVSHELRTPLTVIQNSLELLLPDCNQKGNEREKIFLSVSYKNVLRMGALIEDLLDFSRLELGSLSVNKSDTDIVYLLEQIVVEMESLAGEKDVSIEFKEKKDGIPKIKVDPLRIHQVFINIITNALKFTPKGGTIKIRTEKEKSDVIISIEDNGIGMDKSQRDKIFDKFYQIDGSSSRVYSGLGLGLAIVKTVIDKHGGEIRVESEKDKGSKFIVRLHVG